MCVLYYVAAEENHLSFKSVDKKDWERKKNYRYHVIMINNKRVYKHNILMLQVSYSK